MVSLCERISGYFWVCDTLRPVYYDSVHGPNFELNLTSESTKVMGYAMVKTSWSQLDSLVTVPACDRRLDWQTDGMTVAIEHCILSLIALKRVLPMPQVWLNHQPPCFYCTRIVSWRRLWSLYVHLFITYFNTIITSQFHSHFCFQFRQYQKSSSLSTFKWHLKTYLFATSYW